MSTSKFNNMQDHDEFQLIGKKIPFEVPSGFFESFSENTLKRVITREHIHKRNNIRRLILSVAASIALLFYVGLHFNQNSEAIKDNDLIVDRSQPINQSPTQIIGETPKQRKIRGLNIVVPEKINEKELKTQEINEVLKDVLSDLTDDDLQQIAIRYKTDAFINESLQ
jgi:hypothetical protein